MNKKYRKGELEQERLDQLLEVGWKPHDRELDGGSRFDCKRWHELYNRLAAYSKAHGDCNVPHKYAQDQKLANWVLTQRSRKNSGTLNREREKLLVNINFQFNAPNRERIRKEKWEEHYSTLEEFKVKHGHTNVPHVYEGNRASVLPVQLRMLLCIVSCFVTNVAICTFTLTFTDLGTLFRRKGTATEQRQ